MQARGKRRELVAENKELRKLLRHADRELAKASDRLDVFDEAAKVLGEAGLSDIPSLLAEALVSGHVDGACIFIRFLDDHMNNVFHATAYTHRFKPDVKQWLAFCLTHPSPGRVFDTLAGNPKVRSQMGFILPSLQTLRRVLQPESRTSASDFMGVTIPEQVKAFLTFQKEARRIELLVASHAATVAGVGRSRRRVGGTTECAGDGHTFLGTLPTHTDSPRQSGGARKELGVLCEWITISICRARRHLCVKRRVV